MITVVYKQYQLNETRYMLENAEPKIIYEKYISISYTDCKSYITDPVIPFTVDTLFYFEDVLKRIDILEKKLNNYGKCNISVNYNIIYNDSCI